MLERFERYPLTFGPSPLERLDRLSAHLGGSVEIWARREDCNSGLAFGGNKIRKLEYIVPDALASNADTLVTIGGVQTNHTRQVAAVAAPTLSPPACSLGSPATDAPTGSSGSTLRSPSAATNDAIRLAARLEGMMTDPVYEGKSMQGMIDLVRKGYFPPGSRILHAHLGGVPAINACSYIYRNG